MTTKNKIQKPTLYQKCSQILRRIDPNIEPGSTDHIVGIMLLASATVGPNLRRISRATGIPIYEMRYYATNCRASGVWRGGKVHCEWDDRKNGGIAFIADLCVALGWLKRAPAKAARK